MLYDNNIYYRYPLENIASHKHDRVFMDIWTFEALLEIKRSSYRYERNESWICKINYLKKYKYVIILLFCYFQRLGLTEKITDKIFYITGL